MSDEVPVGRRASRRAAVESELLEVAWRHLAEHGAAALSVRAVARDLGLTPSALFRYVSGRDELLTRLIVAGYESLGDHVLAAHAEVPREDVRARWRTLASATRQWALAHPNQWALLYGSPVPDYQAPGEQTDEPGGRVIFLLAAIGAEAAALGIASPVPFPAADELSEPAIEHFKPLLAGTPLAALPARTLANGLTAWLLLIGAINNELFEMLGPSPNPTALFDYTVECGSQLLFG